MMKFKFILSAAVLAGTAVTGFADGYQDGVEYYQVGQEKTQRSCSTRLSMTRRQTKP